jgi:alanyl-tRNA synthetase
MPTAKFDEVIAQAKADLEHKPATEVLEATKKAVEEINETLQEGIKSDILSSVETDAKFIVLGFENLNKKFLAKVIKELTGRLSDQIVVIKNNTGDNTNTAFVLGNEVDLSTFETNLKELVAKFETIRGGGGRQLHQYGGPTEDINSLVEELESKY